MKKTFEIKNINDFDDVIQEEKDVVLFIDFPSYSLQGMEPLFDRIKKLFDVGYHLEIIIQTIDHNFSEEEIVAFSSLESALLTIHVPLYFDGGYKDYYSLNELIKTDKTLDKVIDKIKSVPLSPLEQFFAVYLYLMKFQYKAEERGDDLGYNPDAYLSRDLISVINNGYIVCEGYARLMEYLLDNLGIVCFKQTSISTHIRHMNNLVYIQDDKYQVKGLYYADSCWDAASGYLVFCLLPLNDIAHLKASLIIDSAYLPFYHVRNYKMLIDGYLLNTPEAGDQRVPDTIKKCNLTNEVLLAYQKGIKLFKRKRIEAIDLLIQTFKEMNVEPEFYDYSEDYPYGSSLSFFTAMLILSKDNIDIVKRQIIEIRRFRELGLSRMQTDERPYFKYDLLISNHCEIVDDVYEFLNSVKQFPYDDKDLSPEAFSDLFSNSEVAISSEIFFGYDTLATLQRALALPKIEETLSQYEQGEPIPIETYRQAFMKACQLEDDYNQETAAQRVESLIHTTVVHSKWHFDEASNYFFQEPTDNDVDDILKEVSASSKKMTTGE